MKSKSYADLRDAAHRKPSSFCTHRAIIRHWSYWIESDKYPVLTEEDRERGEALKPSPGNSRQFGETDDAHSIKDMVNQEFVDERKLLDCLFEKLETNYREKLLTTPSPHEVNLSKRYSVISGYDFENVYNRVIVSRHFNRVSVKHIVDRQYHSRGLGTKVPLKTSELIQQLDAVEEYLKEYFSQLEALQNTLNDPNDGTPDRELYEAIQRDYWTRERFLKWSQESGQSAKVYPKPLKGYENGEAPELYRPV